MKQYVVTISRQFGSMGRTIAQLMAWDLGVNFYDRDIVEETAKRMGLPISVISAKEENANSVYFKRQYPLGMGLSNMQDEIFSIQKNIIEDLAKKESCIIVGRCADYALAEHPNCINVFIHADLAFRIDHVMQTFGLSKEKAADMIHKTDKKRASYYNYYSSKKWGDSRSYHLTLDSSQLGLQGCSEMILSYMDIQKKQKNKK